VKKVARLPTLQTFPPQKPAFAKISISETRMLDLQNTVPMNFAGNPVLAMPIPTKDKTSSVASLQLIGLGSAKPDDYGVLSSCDYTQTRRGPLAFGSQQHKCVSQ
jgi:Asp-tRNA(Asn)/Glu-tRNA(Gln) amidotransferase A subunit family amidase